MELLNGTGTQPAAAAGQQQQTPPSSVYEVIRQEMEQLDPYAETITLTYRLRCFAELFLEQINDDQTLNTLFAQLNEAALADNKFAVKMATVFGSHQLGDVVIQETKIRNAMIGTLQQNFLAIERLKQAGVQRFYNSVTLLGEYYNRKKVHNGRRIHILGQSLLLLLTSELEQEITKCTAVPQGRNPPHRMDADFAKLLLEQITLNGAVAKDDHRKEINDLLFTIRKALITVPGLCSRAKAFLLMAIDFYYSNLSEDLLEKLYNKYLKEPQQPVAAQASEIKPERTEVEAEIKKEEKASPETAGRTVKETGIRTNSNKRDTGCGTGKMSSQQHTRTTTHDKENKRRPSSRTGVVSEKKSSGSSQTTTKRNVRVSEDGKIIATITRDTPNSPTKKAPPSPTAVSGIRPERSSLAKKSLSPRMERLAAVPKITITSSTPSPKRQGSSTATSPRAVLGLATAKQQQQQQPSKHAPKSPVPAIIPKALPDACKSPEGNTRSAKASPSPGPGVAVDRNRPRKAQRQRTEASNGGHLAQSNGEKSDEINSTTAIPQSPTIPETTVPVSHHTDEKESSVPVPNGATASENKPLHNGVSNGRPSSNGSAPDGEHLVPSSTGALEEKAPTVSAPPEVAGKPKVKSYYREDEENLSWNAMMALNDDSPQKLNPHTQSFLSFLADK